MQSRKVPLDSTKLPSHQRAMAGRLLDATDRLEVSVLLRENPDGPTVDMTLSELAAQPVAQRAYLTPRQYTALHGASNADVTAVRRFALEYGLQVTQVDRGMRSVRLAGTATQVNAAFAVELREFHQPGGITYHSHLGGGGASVPSSLTACVAGVVGLDNRPLAHPHLAGVRIVTAAGPLQVNPPDVARAYNFPTIDGTGMTVGIIELGGTVTDADITAYFAALGLPAPTVTHVPVDGQAPVPSPGGANVEVALDVEVIGAMAPGCRIVIYDAPNTEQGFIDAVAAAANDTTHRPSVVSISWGAPESSWTTAGMRGMDAAFAAGNALGRSFCAAAGDNGATDGVADGQFHADHPASSPHVIACGGTQLNLSGTTITSELVWGGTSGDGATGGDVSSTFPRPGYQANVTTQSKNPSGVDGRWVCDVAGNADPVTGWNVTSDGQSLSVGGTSAVAPMWSALLTLVAKQVGHGLGEVHPLLYSAPASAFNDITVGNNNTSGSPADGYDATPGYDPPTGLGSPNGQNLAAALAAGAPSPCPPHFSLPDSTRRQFRGLD